MKRQTVLEHCVERAGVAHVRDEIAGGVDPARDPSRKQTVRAIWRTTHEAAKVAALIATWAVALQELERDEIRSEEFVAWSRESSSTVYRRLAEFRRLFPEYRTPNELAGVVAREAASRGGRPSIAVLIPAA